jgi:putative acetyltransferase
VRYRTRSPRGRDAGADGPGHGGQAHRSAQDRWRAVNARHLVARVRAGATFTGGKLAERPDDQSQPQAAWETGHGATAQERRAPVQIVVDDLFGPQIATFLDEHVQEMRSITPSPESKHALDLDDLRKPEVTFWTVKDGATLVGCGAIKRLDTSHAEVKSMRTAPVRRRDGIASMLLEHIMAEAKLMGLTRLSLETGSYEFFLPARKLYEKFGFDYCEPFADYQADPNSVFMTKHL